MPGIQPGDGVVLLDHLSEGLHILVLYLLTERPDQLGLSAVGKCGIEVFILDDGMRSIKEVDTKVTQQSLQEVILGGVFQEIGLDTVSGDLEREEG